MGVVVSPHECFGPWRGLEASGGGGPGIVVLTGVSPGGGGAEVLSEVPDEVLFAQNSYSPQSFKMRIF